MEQHRAEVHDRPASDVGLVEPRADVLSGYVATLQAGWSPNTIRDVSGEQLAAIRADAGAFLRDPTRREGGGTVTPQDATTAPCLSGRVFWLWDGEFCGAIDLRFVRGTLDLPAHVSGHVGYAVVPWKRGRGHATRAFALLLPVARGLGLPRVLVTCETDNPASRRVIEANGGVAAGEGATADHGGGRKLLFWVDTAA